MLDLNSTKEHSLTMLRIKVIGHITQEIQCAKHVSPHNNRLYEQPQLVNRSFSCHCS